MKGSDVTTIVANVKTLAKTEIEQEAASAGMPAEAVDAAEQQYLAAIDDRAGDIESTFQSTVDEGFRGAFLLVGICFARGVGAACALPGRQAAARAGEGGADALIARNCHPGRRAGTPLWHTASMRINVSSYIPGTSAVHACDARVKIVLLAAYSVTLFWCVLGWA